MHHTQISLFRMPKLFRDLLVLALMTASCLDAIEDNVTTTTMAISTLIATSTYVDSISMRTSTTEENALSPSVTVTAQDDGFTKNLSHALPSPSFSDTVWECPNITKAGVECSCDFPHTLRCTGDRTALQVIETIAKAIAMIYQ